MAKNRQIQKATPNGSTLIVLFQDGAEAKIPYSKLRADSGKPIKKVFKILHEDQHSIILDTDEGEAGIPWDFARHFAEDKKFKEEEEAVLQESQRIFGERLKALRECKGLSQVSLEKKSGVGRVTIHRIEKGSQSPNYETIQKLAKGLDMPFAALVTKQAPAEEKKLFQLDFKIAGWKYHQGEKALKVGTVGIGAKVKLIPEPTCKYDPNAVQVVASDEVIGYLPALYAGVLHEYLSKETDATIKKVGVISDGSRKVRVVVRLRNVSPEDRKQVEAVRPKVEAQKELA
ncbi:MAG: hypothetical protein AMXMBFR33_57810 [Candidatus Xenobia bacterium]